MSSPKFPPGWGWAPRGFPGVPREFPDEDGFPEGSPSDFFSFFLDAILQNEIWPFGAQRKKRKVNVEYIIQFGLGFIDETKYHSVWCIPASSNNPVWAISGSAN